MSRDAAPSADPRSYRLQIRSFVETTDQNGSRILTYPKLIWEEPPGRELTWPLPSRMRRALGQLALESIATRTHLALGSKFLYDDTPFQPFETSTLQVGDVEARGAREGRPGA